MRHEHLTNAPRVQSVDRAVQLLWAVARAAPAGASSTELGVTCGLNRATAWRLLWTLEAHGLVVNHVGSGRWTLGAAVVEIGHVAGLDDQLHDVHTVLEKVMAQSAETAALAELRHGSLVYVDEVMPPAMVAVSWVGRPISLHATSTGKVWLAWSSPDEVDRLLGDHRAGPLTRFTETTITDRHELDDHLRQTRQRGWADCQGEFDESAWGVSSPVFDPFGSLRAVVSIWGPPPRVYAARLAALAEVTQAAAARLSRPGS